MYAYQVQKEENDISALVNNESEKLAETDFWFAAGFASFFLHAGLSYLLAKNGVPGYIGFMFNAGILLSVITIHQNFADGRSRRSNAFSMFDENTEERAKKSLKSEIESLIGNSYFAGFGLNSILSFIAVAAMIYLGIIKTDLI